MIQDKTGQGISVRAGQKLPMETTALKAHSRQPGWQHCCFTTVLLFLDQYYASQQYMQASKIILTDQFTDQSAWRLPGIHQLHALGVT